MRNILLPIFGDDASEARLAAAIRLARAFGSHIECLQVRSPATYVMSDPSGGAYVLEAARANIAGEDAVVRETVERTLRTYDLSWQFDHIVGDPLQQILGRARLADIVVLSRAARKHGAGDPLPIASAVAVEGPAPVLAIPPRWELDSRPRAAFDCASDAVVAWDGSVGASRALRAALPLLAKALSIKVLTIGNEMCAASPIDVVAYLERHGLPAEPYLFQRPRQPTEVALLDALYEIGGDYLVMGAFGHSRISERLFGGVTRQCLAAGPLPLFLAH